jgi:general nucleoside transport system ATP-binding protein
VSEHAVELTGIRKVFGENVALDDVDLRVRRGEVHGLLGENGAGKTTLVNVLTGLYRADAGEIRIKGQQVEVRTPRDAIGLKVGMVHQHFELVQAFSALDNILLGSSTSRRAKDRSAQRARIAELASHYGFDVDLDARVADLEIGNQQKIEILRILATGVEILILDEPTTHLTPEEVEKLFAAIRVLAADGLTVILIAHKLREVLAVVDRITVLRRGRLAGTVDRADADESVIIAMMMGEQRDLPTITLGSRQVSEQPILAFEGLGTVGDGVAVPLAGLDLDLHGGELVGVAGVAGNGQRELVEMIAGVRPVADGRLVLRGEDVSGQDVAARIRAGMAILPGDRLREGVLPGSPVWETYTLGRHVLQRGRWAPSRLRAEARAMIERFDVRTPSEVVPTATLSGGNIQKVLVARALAISGDEPGGVVTAMNPTSGLDVGAAAFVHEQLIAICERGDAVLLISEDLDELLMLCDRVVVLSGGRFVLERSRGAYDRFELGRSMVAAA